MNRRDFTSALFAAAALSGSGFVAAGVPASLYGRKPLNDGEFESLLDENFRCRSISDGRLHMLQLKSVENAGRPRQYYLRFKHALPRRATEDIYEMAAGNGKHLSLHLQPSQSDPSMLEAVVNLQQG